MYEENKGGPTMDFYIERETGLLAQGELTLAAKHGGGVVHVCGHTKWGGSTTVGWLRGSKGPRNANELHNRHQNQF